MLKKQEASIKRRIAIARGREPADLLIKNARLVNLFNKNIIRTNIALADGYIAAIGEEYENGVTELDLGGGYVAPGLIDAHLHIESTLLFPPALAEILIARGTTTLICDPHEIANVLGFRGVMLMLDAAENLPCDFFMTAPSCVPATEMETAGAELNLIEIMELLKHPRIVGLGEMMNYPGVIEADPAVIAKINAAHTAGKVVDGHAPGLSGPDLQGYLAAGISTDHECITAAEAKEKINNGMKVIIRHGSASSSLLELLPLINDATVSSFMFGSDDREAAELIERGHIDDLLRIAVDYGADPFLALRVATGNAAGHYRLYDRGIIAPGYRADLVVFHDLRNFQVDLVIKNGRLAAREGEAVVPVAELKLPEFALNTVKPGRQFKAEDFTLSAAGDSLPVIGVIPGQLITEKLVLPILRSESGSVKVDLVRDLLKIAVVERHRGSGHYAVALVKGLGLREGALASSVAHDSHNIIAAGVEDEAIAAAVNELARIGGGFVVVDGECRVKAALPLTIGGLMSIQRGQQVATGMQNLMVAARQLGTSLEQPFLTLSFLALPVIPSLKITDRGLFDVDNFTFI